MNETPLCIRCLEDFPVAKEPTAWRMGEMRLLKKAPKRVRDRFRHATDDPDSAYLCGNCYFDETD